MTPLFSFLQDSLEVSRIDDEQVRVTVNLPVDLLPYYLDLFNALSGFIRMVKRRHSLAASAKPSDHLGIEFRDRFYARIVARFDALSAQGVNRSAAIKAISAELGKEQHPWAAVDLVRSALSAAGRPGKIGRPRSQNND